MPAIDDEGPATIGLPAVRAALSAERLLAASAPLPPRTAPFDLPAVAAAPPQPRRADPVARRRRVEDLVEPPPELLGEDPEQICAALETLVRPARRQRGWFDWSR